VIAIRLRCPLCLHAFELDRTHDWKAHPFPACPSCNATVPFFFDGFREKPGPDFAEEKP
jgi:hypothetical protein